MSTKQESPFLYRYVSSVSVPGFVIDKLGTDPIEAAQTPFKEGYLPDFSRLVTKKRGSKRLTPGLIQVSTSQKRVFELRYGEKGNVFWTDEYGNPYNILQEKGGNVTNPDVRVEPRAPSGFIIWGIQDSDSILRTVRASNFMRSRHIGTEALVRLTEPEELRFKGIGVTREEFKQKLIQKVWAANHRKNTHLEGGWFAVTRNDVPRLAGELKDMTFYLSTLGRQVSERFHDLKYVNSDDDLKRIMERVFTFWNLKQEFLRKKRGETVILNSNNPADILKYFTTYLPTETAKNYAALHGNDDPNLALIHTFPHLGNVSLAGTIYDLDSVYGEPLGLGDKAVTEDEIKDEIVCLIAGKKEWQQADGIMPLLDGLERKNFYQEGTDFDDIDRKFARTFALRYVEDRGWLNSVPANLEKIESVFRICQVYLDTDKDAVIHLAKKTGKDNAGLLYARSAFSDYPFSIMFDINKRPFQLPDGKDVSEDTTETTTEKEKGKDELIKCVKTLLQLHQINLLSPPATVPAKGKDFFSFETIDEGIVRLHHHVLSRADVANILRLHINGELEAFASGYQPRTLGAFMLTLAQLNTKHLAEAAMSNVPSPDDPQFVEKLVRINEFLELLPPRGSHSKMELVRDYIRNITRQEGDRGRDGFYLEREVNYKSAIALFGRGIITPHLHEMFNHRLFDVIMNEFTEKQAEVLQQAIECPDLVDKLMGPDHTSYLLRLALTGVQVRSGQTKDLAIMFYTDKDTKPHISSALQYFFASQDKDQVADTKLRRVLSLDPDKKRQLTESSWTVNNIESLMRVGKTLHPNSFLASRLREGHLWVNDLAIILKTALDLNDGDLSKMDPALTEILENKEYGPMLSSDKVAGLVMSCIAFGVDLPEILDTAYAEGLNHYIDIFVNFLSDGRVRKEGDIYQRRESYPVNPVYKIMSEGISALPERVRLMFEGVEVNQEFINTFAADLLHALFTDDHGYDGYFRNFFGGMLRSEGYPPETELGIKRYEKFTKSNGKFGWKIWGIVHPDIWNIISKADDKVLTDYVENKIPRGTVRVGITHPRNGMHGERNTDLIECFPPHLYEKIVPILEKMKPIKDED